MSEEFDRGSNEGSGFWKMEGGDSRWVAGVGRRGDGVESKFLAFLVAKPVSTNSNHASTRSTDWGRADLWRRVRTYLDEAAGQQRAWWLIEGTR